MSPPSYRMYWLDEAGQIHFAESIEAATDVEAIARAREMRVDAQVCEVWRGHDGLVATLRGPDVMMA